MKTKITLCLMWLIPLLAASQPKPDLKKIEAFRIAFITQRLQLTPDEAKKFWPVYDQYRKEMDELRKKYKSTISEDNGDEGQVTETEAEKTLNDLIALKQAQLDLSKKYIAEFKKAIPTHKIVLLYKAEEDFKRELVKRMLQNRNGRGDGWGDK